MISNEKYCEEYSKEYLAQMKKEDHDEFKSNQNTMDTDIKKEQSDDVLYSWNTIHVINKCSICHEIFSSGSIQILQNQYQ